MKLHRLRLENFRRHANTDVEFGGGLTAIVGQNGVGKSTLLEAIGFALFGAAATRTGKDLLRNEDAVPSDAVAVELDFDLGGATFQVRRELRGKALTPSASVLVDEAPIVAPGAGSDAAATEELERRIGMGRDAFFTTIVARQKELNKLADLGPTERKRLLLRMLGVDAVEGAIQKARSERRRAEDFLAGLRSALQPLEDLEKACKDAAAAEASAAKQRENAAAAWVAAKQKAQETEEKRKAAQAAQAAYTKWAQERQLQQQQLQALGRAAKDAEEQLLKAKSAHAKWSNLQDAEQALVKASQWKQVAADRQRLEQAPEPVPVPVQPEPVFLEAANEALEAARELQSQSRAAAMQHKAAAAALRQELAELESLGADAPCPTCKRPMETHLPELVAGLVERLSIVEADAVDADVAFQQAKKDIAAAQGECARLERLETEYASAKAKMDAFATREAERKAQLAALPEIPDDWQEQLQAAEAAHKQWIELGAVAKELPERQARAEDLAKQLADVREALERLESQRLEDPSSEFAAAESAHGQAREAERAAERASLQADHAWQAAQGETERVKVKLRDMQEQWAKVRVQEEDARYWAALAGGRGGGRGGGLLDAFKDHLVARIGPAVSMEASRLMSAFTSGRYTEVTLDPDYKITVGDQGIPYPLERFSGGEAD
ncbi:MAG: AAA family ATPase, partial [Thermoplasmatota archaeon]